VSLRLGAGVLVAVAIVVAVVLLFPSPPFPTEVCTPGGGRTRASARTRSADAFVQSLGVNTHLAYRGTAYARFSIVLARLRELGIRHVRDGLSPHARAGELDELKALAKAGIRLTLIAGDPAAGDVRDVLAKAQTVAPDLDGLEGPNEWDLFGGPNWAPELRRYQTELYQAVKSDPALRRVPVLAPSLVHGHWSRLGNIQKSVDLGNSHQYARGGLPDCQFAAQLRDARINSGSRPIWVTETGYQTDPSATNGQPGVAEGVAAGLILRTYLDFFQAGIQRTFIYELADEKPDPHNVTQERHFGLLHYDLTPKPAFLAVRNLISILQDPRGRFAPAPYPVHVAGDVSNVREMTLAKHDGTVDIVVWREAAVWDPITLTPVDPGIQAVTVVLPSRTRLARVFVPTISASAEDAYANVRSVRLELGGDPVIVSVSRSR
jgi:hypothetical protein